MGGGFLFGSGSPQHWLLIIAVHVIQSTWHYGLPKTGGLRAAFLSESVRDLHQRLTAHGSGLATSYAEPRQLLTSLIRHHVHTFLSISALLITHGIFPRAPLEKSDAKKKKFGPRQFSLVAFLCEKST
jgi:hypothetical protein